MHRVITAAAIVLGVALAGQALAAPPTAADCASIEKIDAVWLEGIAALDRNDLKAANDLIGPWNDACPDLPLTKRRVLAAAIVAQRRGDAESIMQYLTRLPEAGADLGSRAHWMLLLSYRKLGDLAAFNRQRDMLLAATDRVLGEAPGARRIERFSVGDYRVSAYETPVDQGPFQRSMEFIIHSDKPFELPTSILITRNAMAESVAPGGPKLAFVDEYSCAHHATLTILPAPLSYAQAKAQVMTALGKAEPPVSRQSPGTPGEFYCAWPQYLTPGFEGDRRP